MRSETLLRAAVELAGMGAVAGALALLPALGVALWLAELGEAGPVRAVRWCVRLLGAVPPVVWGLAVGGAAAITPGEGSLALWVGLALGLLAWPRLILGAEDALRGVPQAQREAARALGATSWEVATRCVLPNAGRSLGAVALRVGVRTLGEAGPALVLGGLTLAPAPPGLAARLVVAQRPQEAAGALAGLLVLVALGAWASAALRAPARGVEA